MNAPPGSSVQSPAAVPRVLVVEDEAKTRLSLADGLGMEGWAITTAETGSQAMQLIAEANFDLVLLDWMLPDGDGIAVLKFARGRGRLFPVLMLTARQSVEDRVAGLDTGADDYLVKPFAFPELLARARALLRRPAVTAGTHLRCGALQLDARARVAMRGGEIIPLSPREVDVLEYLLRHQNQTVTRGMLQKEVWREPNRFTSLDNVIDVQMTRLRRKIDGGASEKLIHTIRGLGYRLGTEKP